MKSHTKLLLPNHPATTSFILTILTIHQLNCVRLVQSAATILVGQQPQHHRQRAGTTDQQQQLWNNVNRNASQQPGNAKTSEQEAAAGTNGQSQFESVLESSDSHRGSPLTSNNNLESGALNYLQKYGYMSAPTNGAETNNLVSEESFSSAILDFQKFAGIAQTGVVDKETLELMKLPRCGNSDKWQHPAASQANANDLQQQQLSSTTVNKVGQLNETRTRLASLKRRRRRKRYALQGSKWRRQELTYRISQYPTRFNGKRHEVDAQIAKAFGIWSLVAPIDFVVKKEGRVHIDIRFASGDHGDGDAFDGPGNTLAHAYFPQYGGDAHFDDQEFWTIDSYAGTNIFQVAAHELGHSLGLGHSNVREALMAPFYQKYKPNFRLHMDDVLAIQALYGEKSIVPLDLEPNSLVPPDGGTSSPRAPPSSTSTTTTSTTTTTTTTSRPKYPIYRGLKPFPFDGPPKRQQPASGDDTTNHHNKPEVNENGHDLGSSDHENPANERPTFPDLSTNGIGDDGQVGSGGGGGGGSAASFPADLCSDSSINAATRTEDGNSYVFKGDYYWLLAQDGLARGYPRRISADWDGLPGKLDAALTWADGKTFFFKGNKYWRFRNKRRDVGYPKLISAGFAGIPDDIDAAFVWSGNGRTYIFKGAEYWRFDSKSDPPVSSEYPRSIKVWSGVPAYVDAALKWENNVTYFFKGNQYYRFNDREFKVETKGRPTFPRQTAEWWFGCANTNLAQKALSSSLRESRTMSETGLSASSSPALLSSSPANVDSTTALNEWSFLAGLEEGNTRPMGTHISDRKPPGWPVQPNAGNNSNSLSSVDDSPPATGFLSASGEQSSSSGFISSPDAAPTTTNDFHEQVIRRASGSPLSNEHFRLDIMEQQHLSGILSASPASSAASSTAIFQTSNSKLVSQLTGAGVQTILSMLILLANMRPIRIALNS